MKLNAQRLLKPAKLPEPKKDPIKKTLSYATAKIPKDKLLITQNPSIQSSKKLLVHASRR